MCSFISFEVRHKSQRAEKAYVLIYLRFVFTYLFTKIFNYKSIFSVASAVIPGEALLSADFESSPSTSDSWLRIPISRKQPQNKHL